MSFTPKKTPSASTTNPPPTIVHRAITLHVDLRALVALGGALILIGALLPWVNPVLEPVYRALRSATSPGWPLLVLGIAAVISTFLPRFRVPRVSIAAAAFGVAAGLWALYSLTSTLSLRDTVVGAQAVSSFSGIGPGVYLTLAGAIISVLAGLAPQPIPGEITRAEIRLWKSSVAIFGSLLVLFVLVAVGLGLLIGGGVGGPAPTPTAPAFNTDLLATPLINVQVNPLGTAADPGPVPAPTEFVPTRVPPTAPAVPQLPPPVTDIVATALPLPSDTPFVPPTLPPTSTPTPTVPPSPTATLPQSVLPTPTLTSTETLTPTLAAP